MVDTRRKILIAGALIVATFCLAEAGATVARTGIFIIAFFSALNFPVTTIWWVAGIYLYIGGEAWRNINALWSSSCIATNAFLTLNQCATTTFSKAILLMIKGQTGGAFNAGATIVFSSSAEAGAVTVHIIVGGMVCAAARANAAIILFCGAATSVGAVHTILDTFARVTTHAEPALVDRSVAVLISMTICFDRSAAIFGFCAVELISVASAAS
jgi:hypothetical protein